MSNNNFTKENTDDATHVSADMSVFYKDIIEGVSYKQSWSGDWVVGTRYPACNELIELSRPIGERKEDFQIPASWLKEKGIKLYKGDKLTCLNASKPMNVTIESVSDAGQTQSEHGLIAFDSNWDWVLTSFADRPNTGEQPVGDDVVVDFTRMDNKVITQCAGDCRWRLYAELVTDIKSWKPNHAAMLKQYQAEQEDEQSTSLGEATKKLIYVCDGLSQEFRNGNVGNASDWLRHIDVAYQDYENAEGEPITNDDKPVYTVEMLIGGGTNVAPIYQSGYFAYQGAKYSIFITENGKEYSRRNTKIKTRPIDNRTSDEKLVDALMDEFNCDQLMAEQIAFSGRFTITLNKG